MSCVLTKTHETIASQLASLQIGGNLRISSLLTVCKSRWTEGLRFRNKVARHEAGKIGQGLMAKALFAMLWDLE